MDTITEIHCGHPEDVDVYDMDVIDIEEPLEEPTEDDWYSLYVSESN